MANDRECHHSMWPMYENDDLVRTKIIIKTSRENLQFCHSLLFLWFSPLCGNNKNISSLQWQQARSLTFTASRWVLRQVNKYKCIPVTKVLPNVRLQCSRARVTWERVQWSTHPRCAVPTLGRKQSRATRGTGSLSPEELERNLHELWSSTITEKAPLMPV